MKLNWHGKPVEEDTSKAILKEVFGHSRFRKGQERLVNAATQGQNVLGIAPTGSGKSLIFQLPALMEEEGNTTLVVSPLIALMRDQVQALQEKGIPALDLHSAIDDRGETLERISSRKAALVYTSPEQLQREDTIVAMQRAKIARVVADEAHCVSIWGHDFRPDYGKIGEFKRKMKIPAVSAFTATASPIVERDIKQQLDLNDCVEVRQPALRKNLSYEVRELSGRMNKTRAIKDLIEEYAPGEDDGVIVYCGRRADTKDIASSLKNINAGVGSYHGEMATSTRRAIEKGFRENNPRILAATNAFGMGIDKPNVRLVIHHDITGSVQNYLQETGRAGRDGEDAHCALLFDPNDLELQQYFIEQKSPDIGMVHGLYKVLKELNQQSANVLPDGYFNVDMYKLYRRFDLKQRGWGARVYTRDLQVNAALELLQYHGIIERSKSYFKLHEFGQHHPAFPVIAETVKTRLKVSKAMMEQMVTYANSQDPTQKMLIDMLDQELEQIAA